MARTEIERGEESESRDSAAPARQVACIDESKVYPLPECFQEESILEYDLSIFPFVEALYPVLKEPPGSDLCRVHTTKVGQEILVCFHNRHEKVSALGPRGNPWNRRFLSCAQTEPEVMQGFMDVYHCFLRDFVCKHLGTSRLAFQANPTFRCHLPGCGAPGRPHRDEDYFHPQCEVNFWVPLTSVFESNSLYAETRRGSGDFRPFTVSPGRLVRFYGNQVWHYTTSNETDSTRVSIDFRVIREEEWSPAAFRYFQLGGYYSVMTADGIVAQGSEELRQLREKYQCIAGASKPCKKKGTAPDA